MAALTLHGAMSASLIYPFRFIQHATCRLHRSAEDALPGDFASASAHVNISDISFSITAVPFNRHFQELRLSVW
jgi:hypothetical protein